MLEVINHFDNPLSACTITERHLRPLVHPTVEQQESRLQVKLIKTGGLLVRHARRLVFQLAEVAVPRALVQGVLERSDGIGVRHLASGKGPLRGGWVGTPGELRLLRRPPEPTVHLDDNEVCWHRLGKAEIVSEGRGDDG